MVVRHVQQVESKEDPQIACNAYEYWPVSGLPDRLRCVDFRSVLCCVLRVNRMCKRGHRDCGGLSPLGKRGCIGTKLVPLQMWFQF